MGRAEMVPEDVELEPRVLGGATNIRRRVNAWGVCHGHPKASQAYYDVCRSVYNAEGRTRLTPDEQETVLRQFGLMDEFEALMEATETKVRRAD